MVRAFFSAALFMLTAGTALADTQACMQTYKLAPDQLGELPKVHETNYEKDTPGMGCSVRYGNNTQWMTVFFFDAKQSRIDVNIVGEYFGQAIGDLMFAARSRKEKLAEFNAVRIPSLRAGLSYYADTTSSDGKTEIVAMGLKQGCMIKMRMTTNMEPDATTRAFWQLAERANAALTVK